MSINDLVHGKSKQNKDYTKRDVLIFDRTGQITVTLWYQMVESTLIEKGKLIVDFRLKISKQLLFE